MSEEEKPGLTLGEIFRRILTKKLIAIVVAAAILVVGTLGLYFGYSRNVCRYVTSFYLIMPSETLSKSYCTLPDGSKFYYSDYISAETLNTIKSGDARFSAVEVGSIVKYNAATLSVEYVYMDEDEDEKTPTELESIEISIYIDQKYFNDKDTAKAFMTELAEYPVRLYRTMDKDFNVYLDSSDFETAPTFGIQIDYIEKQIAYIDQLYQKLENMTIDGQGTQVANKRQSFNAWVDRQQISELKTEAQSQYYLKDYEREIENYLNELVILNDQLEDAQYNLSHVSEYIRDNNITGDGVADVIYTLTVTQTNLQRQVTDILKYVNAYYETTENADGTIELGAVKSEHIEATQAYAEKVTALFEGLTGDGGPLDEYVEVYGAVAAKIASVSYTSANAIDKDGGIGLFVCALISLAAGLIIGCIAAYIAATNKLNKQTKESDGKEQDVGPVNDKSA